MEAMTAMDPALVAGNSFVAALQAQLAVSRALSQVKSVWDPPQAVPYAGQRAPTPAELVAAALADADAAVTIRLSSASFSRVRARRRRRT